MATRKYTWTDNGEVGKPVVTTSISSNNCMDQISLLLHLPKAILRSLDSFGKDLSQLDEVLIVNFEEYLMENHVLEHDHLNDSRKSSCI